MYDINLARLYFYLGATIGLCAGVLVGWYRWAM